MLVGVVVGFAKQAVRPYGGDVVEIMCVYVYMLSFRPPTVIAQVANAC